MKISPEDSKLMDAIAARNDSTQTRLDSLDFMMVKQMRVLELSRKVASAHQETLSLLQNRIDQIEQRLEALTSPPDSLR